jgi:hypothetical protein
MMEYYGLGMCMSNICKNCGESVRFEITGFVHSSNGMRVCAANGYKTNADPIEAGILRVYDLYERGIWIDGEPTESWEWTSSFA